MSTKPIPYPKPKEMGGRLIRKLISNLKTADLKLPLSSHILIAVSGGSDSIALAQLLIKYGRRGGAKSKIHLLHVNHHWRGGESDADADFVAAFAKSAGVDFHGVDLKAPGANLNGLSLESWARDARKAAFLKVASKLGPKTLVFTAHHADDLAETLIWRLFTGAAQTHGAGIFLKHGIEVRPLLNIRKSELLQFLSEEELTWRNDSSNQDARFLRNRMRQELMPLIEQIFPRAIDHLIAVGMKNQSRKHKKPSNSDTLGPDLELVFQVINTQIGPVIGQRLKRVHINQIRDLSNSDGYSKEISLPGGWRLRR